METIVLEQLGRLGGLWHYDENPAARCVFKNVPSNVKWGDLAIEGHAIPAGTSEFPTDAEYLEYLRSFSKKFGLEELIQFNSRVLRVAPKSDGRWVVTYEEDSETKHVVCNFVAVCSGHEREPRMYGDDAVPGLSSFTGKQVHSSNFRSASVVSQQNVLVVGMGCSGVTIMKQISNYAQHVVCCSMRIDPKTPRTRSLMQRLGPKKAAEPMKSFDDFSSLSSVKPKIRKVVKREVQFEDHTSMKPDLIIWCTGFVYSVPFIPTEVVNMRDGAPELYLHMFPTSSRDNTLAFIGFPSATGACTTQVAELQSRLFVAVCQQTASLPSLRERDDWIARSRRATAYKPLLVDFAVYAGELAKLVASSSTVVKVRNSTFLTDESTEGEEGEEESQSSAEPSEVPVPKADPRVAAVTTSERLARLQSLSNKSLPDSAKVVSPGRTVSAPTSPGRALGSPGRSVALSPEFTQRRPEETTSTTPVKQGGVSDVFARNLTPTSRAKASSTILGNFFGQDKKQAVYTAEAARKKRNKAATLFSPHMIPVPVSAACGIQGQREKMEDTHVLLDKIPGLPDHLSSGFWAVYDGHGGPEVARLAEQTLHNKFQKMLINALLLEGKNLKDLNVERMLRRCFKDTDQLIGEKLREMDVKNVGSTAAVCVLLGTKLYVANAGDSEVVLGKVRTSDSYVASIEMSYKHKPRDEREKTRIETMGGLVFQGRVYGTLSVTRGFGDFEFKPPNSPQYYVSPDPDIKVLDLTPDHRYVILACDGLWDKVQHSEAVEYLHGLRVNGISMQDCADWLIGEAEDRISRDNITVVVVDLKWSVEAGLQNPRQCKECQFHTFSNLYCTRCGLPFVDNVDTSMRQAPSVKGKRAAPFKFRKKSVAEPEVRERNIVIGDPTNVIHETSAQNEEEATRYLVSKYAAK